MSKIAQDLSAYRAILFDIDGVLSCPTVPADADGEPMRTLNVHDGYAIVQALRSGLVIGIITGGYSERMALRYRGLGVEHIYMRSQHKLTALEDFCARTGIDRGEIIYCGDDIPDLPVLRAVGLAVAPADAVPEVLGAADYVSPVLGGYGVARDIIGEVMRAQGLWMRDEEAFGW